MSKKLRRDPIYIAPEIIGWLDEEDNPVVFDEKNNQQLNPRNIDDKIIIYERQVKSWFLSPASNFIKYRNKNKGFIVLMICLSYLEGVEQYRQGIPSHGNSRNFFVAALERMYPGVHTQHNLREFYSQARCGLFHSGMVQGKIIMNSRFHSSLEFDGLDIKVSPKKLLADIENDFNEYLRELRTIPDVREKFDEMYSNI